MTGQARYQQAHRAIGLCRHCPRPARPGRISCESCGETDRARAQAIVEERIAAGLCSRCGLTELGQPGGWCEECRKVRRAKLAARREANRAA